MDVRSTILILLTVFVHVNAMFPTTLNITCSSIKYNTTAASLTVNNVDANNTVTIQNKNCTKAPGTHSFTCPTNTSITLELRSGNLKAYMIDGSHFQRYIVSCNRKLNPYIETLHASENFSVDGHQIITERPGYFTQTVPYDQKYKFQMAFENGNRPFTVGTNLTLKITHQPLTNALLIQKILVLECKATGSQPSTEKYALSDTNGCKADTYGLFSGKWRMDNTHFSAEHTLSAFRFESSNKVTIACKVRVCMDPYDKSDCDEPVCTRRKRRANRQPMSDKTSHTSVQTQFEVYDSFVAIGNSAEGVRVIYSWTMVCCLFVSYFRIYC